MRAQTEVRSALRTDIHEEASALTTRTRLGRPTPVPVNFQRFGADASQLAPRNLMNQGLETENGALVHPGGSQAWYPYRSSLPPRTSTATRDPGSARSRLFGLGNGELFSNPWLNVSSMYMPENHRNALY
jgi:hypothetical protein